MRITAFGLDCSTSIPARGTGGGRKKIPGRILALATLAFPASALAADTPASIASSAHPNIVYILCDDLGYGDVRCLGGERAKIPTPHLDRLAAEGMVFTDAHSGSAVCTPTRYGILTGRYAWRTRLQNGVLLGYDRPLIAPGRLTVPALLKQHGYTTACIGKWHLGLDISKEAKDLSVRQGPVARGFDSFFGISASLDMPPYTFIENDRMVEAPTAVKDFGRKGAAAPGFEAAEVLPVLTRKAVEYIGGAKAPFFLYLPLTSPHTPIVPTEAWRGKSGLNPYADFVMQTDWSVGRVMAALEQAGVAGNTLVIFTSDNGCSPAAKTEDLEAKGHYPSETRRGYKADIWDGGHRVPFIARWPGKIKAGSRSGQLTCLTDLMATCAEVVGAELPPAAGEDSVSILPAPLTGATDDRAIVHHSIKGKFAIRRGKWKLALCPGSGGWSKGGDGEPVQLYDLSRDDGERENLYARHPGTVAEMTRLLEDFVASGRSTPGPRQGNDVNVTNHFPAGPGRVK